MIDLADLHRFVRTRHRLHRFVHARPEGLAPRREWSEGLERFVDIETEPWSYVATRQGWLFTCRQSGALVPVRADGKAADAFSAGELCAWLRSRDEQRYGRLNEVAVENWLTHAYCRGLVHETGELPGYFRPRR